MQVRSTIRAFARAPSLGAALCSLAGLAQAQLQFSIDYRGMSIALPATGSGVCITEGDILAPATPGFAPGWGLPPPFIVASGGFGPPGPGLGLPMHPGCTCHPPAMVCGIEIDALSHGFDYEVTPGPLPAGTYVFSVDACAVGIAASPLAPNVASEAPSMDTAGDVFQALGLPPGPVPPGPVAGHTGIVDGNGMPSGSGYTYVEAGLFEPTFPGPGPTGDNIDAIDFDAPAGPPWYWSADAAFPNPCTGAPNTGSAIANGGFPPAAVMITAAPGGPFAMFAPPPALGLDMFGPGTDDIDGIALSENGSGVFEPSMMPYDWLPIAGPDMLLFTVRPGSAVIGMPDSIFCLPIEAGDILTTPLAGGCSPFPGIFVAAEALGLTTARGGGPMSNVDALDTRFPPQTGTAYCFGDGSGLPCPCGNIGAPGNGCASTAVATGANLVGTGLASVAADSVTLSGSGMPPGRLSLFFQGTTRLGGGFGVISNDGRNCAGGAGAIRLGTMTTTAGGTSFYPNGALGHLPVSVRGAIPGGGGTRHYTIWYRDGPSICTAPSAVNFSNGFSIVWTP